MWLGSASKSGIRRSQSRFSRTAKQNWKEVMFSATHCCATRALWDIVSQCNVLCGGAHNDHNSIVQDHPPWPCRHNWSCRLTPQKITFVIAPVRALVIQESTHVTCHMSPVEPTSKVPEAWPCSIVLTSQWVRKIDTKIQTTEDWKRNTCSKTPRCLHREIKPYVQRIAGKKLRNALRSPTSQKRLRVDAFYLGWLVTHKRNMYSSVRFFRETPKITHHLGVPLRVVRRAVERPQKNTLADLSLWLYHLMKRVEGGEGRVQLLIPVYNLNIHQKANSVRKIF